MAGASRRRVARVDLQSGSGLVSNDNDHLVEHCEPLCADDLIAIAYQFTTTGIGSFYEQRVHSEQPAALRRLVGRTRASTPSRTLAAHTDCNGAAESELGAELRERSRLVAYAVISGARLQVSGVGAGCNDFRHVRLVRVECSADQSDVSASRVALRLGRLARRDADAGRRGRRRVESALVGAARRPHRAAANPHALRGLADATRAGLTGHQQQLALASLPPGFASSFIFYLSVVQSLQYTTSAIIVNLY